jgi:1A family penicillin-binding protein
MRKRGLLAKLFRLLRTKAFRKLIVLFISLCFITGGMVAIWIGTMQIPDLSAFESRKVTQSTKIFDRTGEILLYDIHEDAKRTVVPYEEISRHIKNATVAIEDAEFYEHFGIKPKSILRAVFANFTSGSFGQGGSTITQQVIKNSVLTKDKTITRKLKEWVLAIKIEKILTKDQILDTYLNESPYGGSLYGVEEASKTFFGKSSKDVSLGEAAYLAALPQAPTFYSPYGKNKDRLDERQRLVLAKMKENGFINDEEYEEAKKEEVKFLEKGVSSIRAPHFSFFVKDYLVDKYGEELVNEGGLKITTTLDYTLQETAEKVINKFAKTLEENYNASNTAMVAVDPKTGDILTMVGSRDYFDTAIEGNFNITTALRQPGSAFKPFVYATAFQKGYTPETVLFDVETEFSYKCEPDGKPKETTKDPVKDCYSPQNYDEKYPGPMTMREALAQSRNIPAVKTLYLAGLTDSIETAENMGITSLNDPNRYGLTLVLGGGEVSLLELTGAYSVFANDGIRNPNRAVLKVEDSDGNVLEEARSNSSQAISSEAARQISDILSDPKVRLESLNSLIGPLGKQVAIKTGTTNDYRDVWVVGYTPDIAVGAWAGKNDNTPMQRKIAGLIIAPVWGAFMSEINDVLSGERFKAPPTPETDIKPVLKGIWQGGIAYEQDTISKKRATEFTPAETRVDVVFPDVHSILRWVNKRDPRGAIPDKPEDEPQYEYWEYGVRKWFEEWKKSNPDFKEVTSVTIPTEVDDVHIPANFPRLTIKSPNDGDRVDRRQQVQVSIETSGKYPAKKAELYVNGQYVMSNNMAPFTLSFVPRDIENISGTNTIKVVLYDSVFNKVSQEIEFSI